MFCCCVAHATQITKLAQVVTFQNEIGRQIWTSNVDTNSNISATGDASYYKSIKAEWSQGPHTSDLQAGGGSTGSLREAAAMAILPGPPS